MNPDAIVWLHAAEIFFEIAGAFLLAAEAIKVTNLVELAARLEAQRQAVGGSRFGVFMRSVVGLQIKRLPTLVTLLVLLIIACALAALYDRGGVVLSVLWSITVGVVFFLSVGIVYALSSFVTIALSTILRWIEEHTTNGVVGMLGFSAYLVSVIIREVLK